MDLIIVESPTKAKTISRFLGKDYQILSTMGHIRDLPKSSLGVDLEKNFKPQYVVVPGKEKTVNQLKKEAKSAQTVYLATDPDREGEAIAHHAEVICSSPKPNPPAGGQSPKFSRIVFHEITELAVKKALVNPGVVNKDLVNAQVARRVLDRLVGYRLSPVLWKKIRRGLSAGRVQSVVVRLIVEREREINRFKREEYWRILVAFTKGTDIFIAELISKGGKKLAVRSRIPLFADSYTVTKTAIKNERQALDIIFNLNEPFRVEDVDTKELSRHSPPPFTTSTLQQSAYRKLGFSSKQTMRLAQRLYERGWITYHRTDSTNLASMAVEKMRQWINSQYGRSYLPPEPNFYKTKARVAQEAHEAIRPTDFNRREVEKIGNRENRLYRLIWSQAVSSQMTSAKFENTKVEISGEDYVFLVRGSRLIFDGYLKAWGGNRRDEERLPLLKKGDVVVPVTFSPIRNFTSPPPRYSEASLIAILEKEGIGRPSTYAPIISTIQNRRYAEKSEGQFEPTVLGMVTNDFLVDHFKEIVSLPFTANMEEGLDKIANGGAEWKKLIGQFYQPFQKQLEKVEEQVGRVKIPVQKTGKKCPKCKKGELVIRTGRFGKFLSCSRFPECRYTAPYIEKLLGVKCPQCGGDVVIKRTRKGKQFYGCSNYPQCKWASWRKPKEISK
ncbi:type I DNA topoisomerase [Candidatus Shapirobacteria bacterium CG09_land_8_20_14_0_10_38_17]|uniref:DNA topoisomerase 1 n=1 Tax=Candidatus Shapirobacteria bacterium CG09_land_8_20_14_0_10_38_17 TaxID=1974884 RepID=A0A2H0WRC4_9BACT|nr:MAG: type I DNA topoisomerase [Candidatus Shapirobacteria bacterium CG09_land_8_20_14_0_10_38_17]